MLRKQHKPSKSRSRRQSLGRQRRSTAPSLKGMPTSDSTAPELRHDTLYHLDHDSTQLLPTTAPSATPHGTYGLLQVIIIQDLILLHLLTLLHLPLPPLLLLFHILIFPF